MFLLRDLVTTVGIEIVWHYRSILKGTERIGISGGLIHGTRPPKPSLALM